MIGGFQVGPFQTSYQQAGAITPVSGGSGGGGDLFEQFRQNADFRPNWYHFPEEKTKIKRAIVKAAKEKKRIEARISVGTDQKDFQQSMALLNNVQTALNNLMEQYQESLKQHKFMLAEAEEEAEFMELLNEII